MLVMDFSSDKMGMVVILERESADKIEKKKVFFLKKNKYIFNF